MALIAATADRVTKHTDPEDARRIAQRTADRLAAVGTNPRLVRARLAELDREWDIERAIEANASSLALVGTVLGLAVHRAFFALPLVVSGFLLQHALQGWCPPVPLLRRAGFRTHREIEDERHELLKRRGGAGRSRSGRARPTVRRPRLEAA